MTTTPNQADDLTITAAGMNISGWETMRLTRGIERIPSDFSVTMTERYPGELGGVFLNPGLPVEVKLGDDPVLTGYVDQFAPSFAPGMHSITLTGRSKCADLVDCSAEWPAGQISNSNALQVAEKLAKPYGIKVKALSDPGAIIPQYNLLLTSPAYEVIEEICRFAALLAYDDTDGNLVLSRAGSAQAASGFMEGKNVQTGAVSYTQHDRYQDYQMIIVDMDLSTDFGTGGNALVILNDQGVLRHRVKSIVADNSIGRGVDGATKLGGWQMRRRFGRSAQVRVTVDSWRDAAGKLWAPNTLAPIHLPSLHATDLLWLISEVTYFRDATGTRAEVILMPPEAFEIPPYRYQLSGFWDLPQGKLQGKP